MSKLLIVLLRRSSFLLTLRVLLGLCFLLSPVISRAQTALPQQVSVAQAVQEAIDKNLNLLAERYNLTIADAHIVTARLRPNPVLSVSGNIIDDRMYNQGTTQ